MPATPKAKSTLVAQLVRLAHRERLSYDEFSYVCQQARKHLGLTKPPRVHSLPHLLSADELTRFFRAVRDGKNVQHEIMLKLLFLQQCGSENSCGLRSAMWTSPPARFSWTRARG